MEFYQGIRPGFDHPAPISNIDGPSAAMKDEARSLWEHGLVEDQGDGKYIVWTLKRYGILSLCRPFSD